MDFKSQKTLICDDSLIIRVQLRDLLKSIGYDDILEACNGQEAIDIYKKVQPELVLMDIIMPVKDGIEAINEIIAFNANAKIIAVSSIGTNNYITKATNAGAIDFIQKPVENQVFTEVLRKNGFSICPK